jgi:hypothetical protein
MEQDTPSNPIPSMRVLKIGNCPTQSGKGKLEYHIGYEGESKILFRVTANSGGGYFSPEWVSFASIQDAFTQGQKPLTSFALYSLFSGKSINTPAFLFAALKAEGLVQADEDFPRCYVEVATDGFKAEMTKLIASGTDLKVPAKVSGKGVVKSAFRSVDVIPVITKSRGRPKGKKSATNKT